MNPKLTQKIAKSLLCGAVLLTSVVLFFIIFYILYHGLSNVNWNFLTGNVEDLGKKGGIFPTIVSTIYLTALSVLIAAPLGIGTALYLTCYTEENLFTKIVRFGTDCLAAIPSIIFGLFGFMLFVIYLRLSWSILSGALTLASMMLPTIIRTTEEAIRAVPSSYMDVNYALGGTKLQGIVKIILPKALPGILTGVILSMGRAVSETAALIFTAGMSLRVPVSMFASGRSMAVHFYSLAREGISLTNAFATASVLMITVLIINIVSYLIMHLFLRKYI
ncbi:phosphate ABC transporter permease PstA [Candidatus Microgenomates bacterium]|nr:phosphate ABC transporter permease PstA [Candidatus Microgenomates bacterium]